MNNENLGIEDTDILYHAMNNGQNLIEEINKTREFLVTELPIFLVENNLFGKDHNLKFINYGNTELVYVLTIDDKRYTLLVGQPKQKMGVVKREFQNLQILSKKNKNVISPLGYFSNNNREAYLTPYIYQARDIAARRNKFGLYIPEPNYHFEYFDKDEQELISTTMLSNLIELYDEKECLAIGECHLGEGDFILEKSWSTGDKDPQKIRDKMKLTAARKLLNISLNDYIMLIENEFTKLADFSLEEQNSLINYQNRVAFTTKEITTGIEKGLQLRKEKGKSII